MSASTVTMPEARRAAELYASGMTQEEVGSVIGHSRKSVSTALRRLGVPLRSRAESLVKANAARNLRSSRRQKGDA